MKLLQGIPSKHKYNFIVMHPQLKFDCEHLEGLREAQRQNAATSIVRRYALAEKITGMTTAERVAAATRKRRRLSRYI